LKAVAIVPAAGRGERLGPGTPKALRALAGVPMLVRAVHSLAQSPSVELVVVVAPPEPVTEVRALLPEDQLGATVSVVAGGVTRQQSVRLGLSALPDQAEVVLVHDAARPLVPVELVDAVVRAVWAGADAVVPALPVTDTVKAVNAQERVTGTPDRAVLRSVQTPQGFRRSVLEEAHGKAADGPQDSTDDAGLVEGLGVSVQVIAGHEEAFKVTRPIDLVLAEALVARRRAGTAR
jgi:2-C-methyl-D-erythritol 4-phosphate cytidylyltransferase